MLIEIHWGPRQPIFMVFSTINYGRITFSGAEATGRGLNADKV